MADSEAWIEDQNPVLMRKKRDNFAKAAMVALLRKCSSAHPTQEELEAISQSAYAMADAMLEERKKVQSSCVSASTAFIEVTARKPIGLQPMG